MKINCKFVDNLKSLFPYDNIEIYNNWSKITTIGIGKGKVTVIEPCSENSLVKILKYTRKYNIPITAIGAGSNTIGTDSNDLTLLLKLTADDFKRVKINKNKAECGAGITLLNMIKECAKSDLSGLSQLAGIPGTLGGSLKTNASRLGVSIFNFIEYLEGYNFSGEKWSKYANEIKWGYRYSDLPEDIIVTKVHFRLKPERRSKIQQSIENYIKERAEIYPKFRNAGCIFKNPESNISSGQLIDLSGCKNMSCNNLEVSGLHANFITNRSISKESDFLELAGNVRKKVFENFGIYLTPEVYFINNKTFKKLMSTPPPLTVTLLKGGNCRERSVSLESAKNVSHALKKAGYTVNEYDIKKPVLPKKALNCDVAFPVLHGGFGEDGRIQKVLENNYIPFVGSDSNSSELTIDKIKTKKIFCKNQIKTPDYAVLKKGEIRFPKNLKLPVVVKHPSEGSTFGISIVRKMNEWKPALKKASAVNTENILVEEYIDGEELTVSIIDSNYLPMIHISPPGEMYDYDAKYTHRTGETLYICPPEENLISSLQQLEIQKTSLEIYKMVGARDMLRVDMILSAKTKEAYFIEVNSIPGFTSSSLLPKAAEKAGISYIQLCCKLIQLACNRKS
ncbi:MAG: D-alanine--D-alanine ligase [Victivallales bacterium]|nr:D-alanine--D-alanine ligase [Victivallales bacterium]